MASKNRTPSAEDGGPGIPFTFTESLAGCDGVPVTPLAAARVAPQLADPPDVELEPSLLADPWLRISHPVVSFWQRDSVAPSKRANDGPGDRGPSHLAVQDPVLRKRGGR